MSDSESDRDEVEEYDAFAQPTLIDQLRKILDEYPDDGQIIKELIQNADDAGASQMKILYIGDQVNPPQEAEKKYRKFLRAPALVFYNDAKFNQDDWTGIRTIYNSVKADDPLTVGRFGLGFKSVFHITDYPCIISGDRILFLNPLERKSHKVCVTIPLRKLHLSTTVDISDVLAAFNGVFGFTAEVLKEGNYPGTIFWFPLRSEPTKLSSNLYKEYRVLGLFKAFMADAEMSLLFLKGLQKIRLFCKMDSGLVQNISQDESATNFSNIGLGVNEDFYTVELKQVSSSDNQSKTSFINAIKRLGGKMPEITMHQAISCTLTMTERYRNRKPRVTKQKWFTVNLYPEEPADERLKILMADKDLCYSPLVAVAACIEQDNKITAEKGGKIFCFQPLPEERENRTGLPVHLNGFFALTQNRRHIKLPSSDQELFHMHLAKPIEWNIALMSDILPEAYVKLILDLIGLLGGQRGGSVSNIIYNILPDFSTINPKWKAHAEQVFRLLLRERFLFTEANGGEWVSANQAVFATTDCIDGIRDVLTQTNIRLVLTPADILQSFEERNSTSLQKVTPKYMTDFMSRNQSYRSLTFRQKMELLQFLYYSDCENDLHSLELLPHDSDTFSSLAYGKDIYIEDQHIVDLFQSSKQKFVSTKIDKDTSKIFEDMASKGVYKVKKLDTRALVQLIEETFESDFETQNAPLKVDKTKCHKYKMWLEHIWTLILTRFPNDVHEFEHLPIFPVASRRSWSKVQSFLLYPLTSLLLANFEEDDKKIPKEVLSCFELLSVIVVQSVPEWMDESIIRDFIYRCSGHSLAKMIAKVDSDSVKYFNSHSDTNQKRIFLEFLCPKFNKDMLDAKSISILKQLQIFKERGSNHEQCVSRYVSARESRGILSYFDYPIVFPYPLLELTGDEEKFANMLDVFKVESKQMVIDTFGSLQKRSNDDVVTFMYWVLTNQFHERSSEVADRAKEVRFLEGKEGMAKPRELFDPTDTLLIAIFSGFNIFPIESKFLTPKLLPALRDLGLKTRENVNPEDIYNACKRIHNSGNYKKDHRNATNILKFLNLEENNNLLQSIHVSNLNWIPVQDCNKMEMVQFNKGRGTLVSPREVRSSAFRELIGYVSPVLDCSKYENLARHFRWNDPPPLLDIATQLHVLATNYTDSRKANSLSTIIRIYEWFAEQPTAEVKESLEEIFHPNLTYMWNGNGFCTCDKIIVNRQNRDINLQPFLWYLPVELSHLKEFFDNIGCLEDIKTEHYVDVLKQMKVMEASFEAEEATDMLRLAINILNKIREDIENGTDISNVDIYVPVRTESSEIVFKPAKLCTYGNNQDSLEEGFLCVHEDIPLATALAVGVQSFKQQMMSELEGIEEWGQTEPLTRRIHNLLKEGYVDGFSVPKELFQNADDAKASKLWLLYDERENVQARTNLLNDAMEEVQGPALWVYNDAKFTEADLKSITKLSGATKERDASKVGKFGLGFCSVYNLTDVPSFLSGENVIIFDPHTEYLGNALPGRSPGLRINIRRNKNRKMLERYRNQFLPFEDIFGCGMLHEMQSYEGTLFRLPLRTKKGKISDIIYRDDEIQDLMEKIRQFSSNMLIFSQHVKEVKLFHLRADDQPHQMRQIFDCSKSADLSIPNGMANIPVLSEACRIKKVGGLTSKLLKKIEKVCIRTNDKITDNTWTVHWFVSWSMGSQEKSISLALADEGAIPLAATAIPVRHEQSRFTVTPFMDLPSCFYQKPHFFCILPLPIEHEFPIHINGQFSVSSDRRRLRSLESEDKRNVYKEWNESLMSDAVVEATVHMLENLHRLGTMKTAFYNIWPRENKQMFTENYYRSFYKHIISKDSKVFEKRGQWYSLSECTILTPTLRTHEIGEIAFEIFDRYSTDKTTIDVPHVFYDLLVKADEEAIKRVTVQEEEFFLKYFLPNLQDVATSEIDNMSTLLKYAIGMNNMNIDEWIRTNESLPTLPNYELKCPRDIVDRESIIGPLFKEADGRFLIAEFTNDVRRQRLWSFGIIHDILPNEMLVERALKVEQQNQKCSHCAIELCRSLLGYMQRNESEHEKAWDQLRPLRFLPVANKPKAWQSEWEADRMNDGKMKKPKLCKDHKKVKEIERRVFEKSTTLYSTTLAEIIGCNFLILDAQACSRPEDIHALERFLQKNLGLRSGKDVRPDMAVEQIAVIAKSCQENADSINASEIGTVLGKVYKFLDSHSELKEMDKAKGNRDLIWTSTCFTNPNCVAFSLFGLDCSPVLYDLEKSPLKHYRNLCNWFGVQQTFELEYLIATLRTVYEQSLNEPVAINMRRATINIIECISCKFDAVGISYIDFLRNESVNIFAPDTDWILRDSRTLCFNDESGIETNNSMILVNDELKIKTAKTIGIKSKLNQKIQDTSDSVDSVEFFQDEPLVTRLNNILSGYPLDSGIFKELIQNADDAGAEEIHFLLDKDSYGNDVFDGSFDILQGPALCVYNDKPFTQNDLKGIQNLGKGSKGEDPSKTGQYGVGFNSVYNFTDAPSFLTKGAEIENGETLCIFDPMAKFLPSLVSREKPGRRFKDIATIRQKHKDVLIPYNESLFMKSDQGTIFRFPLRLSDKGYSSGIKDENISVIDTERLLKEFLEEAAQTLIFLKNLRTIKVSIKRVTVTLEAEINLTLSDNDLKSRKSYFQKHVEVCKNFKTDRKSIFTSPTVSEHYEIQIEEKAKGYNFPSKSHYLVVQTIGFKDIDVPKIVQERCRNGDLGLLPQGGLSCRLPSGGNANTTHSNRPTSSKAFCFLPLPGETGLPVHVNGHFALDHEGRRGLWESDAFDETTCYKTLWNKSIVEGVICPAYLILLDILMKKIFSKLKQKGGNLTDSSKMLPIAIVRDAILEYCSYLPVKDMVKDNYWIFLLRCIYTTFVNKGMRFLPSLLWVWDESRENTIVWKAKMKMTAYKNGNSKFTAFHNASALALDGGTTNDLAKTKNGCKMTNILQDIGMNVVVLPHTIRESMKFSDVSIKDLDPKSIINFLCSYKENGVGSCSIQVNQPVGNTAVKSIDHMCFLVSAIIKDKAFFKEKIHEMPVFITKDSVVKLVSEQEPMFVTRFQHFFENTDQKFLCHRLADIVLKKGESLMEGLGLKRFSLDDFIQLLMTSKLKCLKRGDFYTWDQKMPDQVWIRTVWTFFNNEICSKVQKQEEKSDTESCVEPFLQQFAEIAIVPAARRASSNSDLCYLVPPCQLKRLLNVDDFPTGVLKNTLSRLNLPTVQTELFGDKNTNETFRRVLKRVPCSQSPEMVAQCLSLNKELVLEAKLSAQAANPILVYFSENCDSLGDSLSALKDMPLFTTVQNELISLTKYQRCVSLLCHDVPNSGLEKLSTAKNVAIIKSSRDVSQLFEKLGIIPRTPEELYIDLILPSQSLFSRDVFYKHIEYICQNILNEDEKDYSKEKKKILDLLKTSKFIEVQEGKHVCVSKLFNPRVKIFSMFCTKKELLPNVFDKELFIKVFEKLGLQSCLTVQLFERFAREISDKGKDTQISQSVRNKSGRLLKEFMNIQDEISRESGFSRFAKIPFIIPAKIPDEIAAICDPYLKEDRMVSFSESVFYDKMETVWTACPILPETVKIKDRKIREQLEMKPDDFFKSLLEHCRNVGAAISEITQNPVEQNMSGNIEKVMICIYECLLNANTRKEISQKRLKQLSDIPMIFFRDGPSIHKPSRIVITCNQEDEIRPYLNQMPIYLGKYSDIFQLMGAAKQPTAGSYIGVLQCLKDKCMVDEMISPDLIVAKKAIKSLLTHGVIDGKETFAHYDILYLPTIHLRMEDARSVIICDNKYMRKRLGMRCNINYFLGLEKLEIENIKNEQCLKFFKSLPSRFRPAFLTDIVEENIEHGSFREKPSSAVRELESFIRSTAFTRGLVRLVKHAYKERQKKFDEKLEENLNGLLNKVRLVSGSGMKTVMSVKTFQDGEYKNPKQVPESEETKTIHIEENNSTMKVYIEITQVDWREDLKKAFASQINISLPKNLTQDLFLIFLDFFKFTNRPSGISDMLDKNKVVSHTFSSTEEPSLFGKPGEFVPVNLHQFLDNDYTVIYDYEYDCIAYELDDPVLEDGTNSDGTATYIFARIIRKVQSTTDATLFEMYEVDIGQNETMEIPGYKLFKFVRKTNSSTALVVYQGNEGDDTQETSHEQRGNASEHGTRPEENTAGGQGTTNAEELSIHGVCKEIKANLTEAWTKKEKTRKQIVKRLLLKWHPDKNHGREAFATKVFQYIQQCLANLEAGKPLQDYSDGTTGGTSEQNSGGQSKSGSGRSRRGFGFDDDFWDDFFERFERQQRRYPGFSSGRSRRSSSSFYFDFEETEREPYKWISAAKKWQDQAKRDFGFAMDCLTNTHLPAFNWICFILHQAAEKSLRAAWYAKDAYKLPSESTTDLESIATGLIDTLREKARRITDVTRTRRRMTYPNVALGELPAELYTRGDATCVCALTKDLIDTVSQFYIDSSI